MAKKKVIKKSPEIDIKIRNFEKVNGKCYMHKSGNFWIFGSALAMILSYERSSSILWAILHGVFSWFYILFRSMQLWGWF